MNIKTKTFESAIRMLKALDAKYVIVYDGEVYATEGMALAEPPKPRKRIASHLPFGTLLNYARPIIDGMKVGDVVEMDACPGATLESLRSSVSSHYSKLWGSGALATTVNRKTNKLEILRVL